MKRSLFSILMLLVFGGLVVGCGGNNRDFVVTGNNNVPTGTVTLQFATARGDIRGQIAPAGSDQVRVSGFDSGNTLQFGPQTLPIATTIVIQNVPVSVVRMDGEYLLGGTVLGRFSEAVTVTEGGNTTVTNPTLLPATDGNLNSLAVGDYFLVAGTLDLDRANGVERESNVAASITLDGNGNIAAGAVSTVQHDGTVAGAHLGGTYTLFTDGSVAATLNSILSTVNFNGGIEGGVGQGNPMGFAQGAVDMDNGETGGLAYMVLRGSGLSNASLNGQQGISLVFTSVGDSNGTAAGELTFDGAGNISAATLRSVVLNNKFQTTGDFTLSGASTYTVATNGDFTATVPLGTFTLNLSGVLGVDGQTIVTAVIAGNASGIGRIDAPEAQVTTRSTGIRAQSTEGLRKVTYVKSSVTECQQGQRFTVDGESGKGSVQVNSQQGDFTGVTTSGPGSSNVRGLSGSLGTPLGGTSIQIGGLGTVVDASVSTTSDGARIIRGTIRQEVQGNSFNATLNVPVQVTIFDCAPTPGTITPPTPEECPDLTSEFDVNRAENISVGLSLNFVQKSASTVDITGFKFTKADNPSSTVTGVTGCASSIFPDVHNFTSSMSFSTETETNGDCEWSGSTTQAKGANIFVDVLSPTPVQSSGTVKTQVLGTKNGVPNQKIGTITSTVTTP